MDIKIDICAQYRDMLPRLRLVCQEPGLRLIGLMPGVPDKISRGLGAIFPVFCTDFNLFCSIHFPIFNSSVGLVGNLAQLPPFTVPSAVIHCNQNETAYQTIKCHNIPCRGAAGWKHSVAFMPQNWWSWYLKLMKSIPMGCFQCRN